MRTAGIVVLGLWLLPGCGSAKSEGPPPAAPERSASGEEGAAAKEGDEAAEPEEARAAATAGKLPTECVQKGDVCTMPKDFVKRLCQETYPNVALALFASGTPWTHAYLTRKTQAWNAEGGASVQDWLEFDEEVLVLSARIPPAGGMQVSGMGGYQALRWDGSCVTLATEEVTTRRPPSPKRPRIEWRWLDDGMREALRKSPEVDAAYQAQRKECKGISVGEVTKKCEDADKKLVRAITDYVSSSSELPQPERIP